ncbi:MAG: DGQHR domain-containing protein [Bacteroidales bacterium]|nr:DGQHR domain-containing protein [Bacteroidales bacterium]
MNIPALKGKIGDTVFYSANLTMRQIAKIVVPVNEELYTAKSLRDQLQRSLNNNYLQIKEYILSHPDRFFNALVLAVYDGDPLWTEIRYELDEESFSNVGILSFNGREKIFPVDGQHRVEGIKAALKENRDLENEQLCVMLIGHSNTSEGKEKSRRVFSTLNRYAKPVKLGDIIALDEDDVVAIATRFQLESNPLFKEDRVRATNSIAISVSDKRSFTSLIALYQCNLELFKCFYKQRYGDVLKPSKFKEYLKNRPTDEIINAFNDYLTNFWTRFIEVFPEICSYIADNRVNAAESFRSVENGGNILFRPVALTPLVTSIATIALINDTEQLNDILDSYSKIERTVSASPWEKIIWDPIKHQMITRTGGLVKYMMISMYDSSLLRPREKEKLIADFQSIYGIERDEAETRIMNLRLTESCHWR